MLRLEFWVAGGILFVISLAYNRLAAVLDRKGFPLSLTPLLVVLGTFYTLFGAGFVVGWDNAILTGLLFICSGGPMIWGGLARFLRSREREAEAVAEITHQANNQPRNHRRHNYYGRA
jgi:hypothetical protein